MDRFFKQVFSVVLPLLFFTVGIPTQRASAQYENAYVSYNDFYQNLAPYGQWIEDPQYGYVWSPNVDGSFRPYYTNGHWVMTDYGNTWLSDYPWGWACFHYGRWTYDSYYGWLWIPGSDWGPAWVGWRDGDGYYGWAPLGPGYDPGSATADYSCPNDWWVFIPPQYLYTGSYYRYWYGPHGNSEIIKNSTYLHNHYENNSVIYVAGPRQKDVENVTHQPVSIYHITSSATNLNTRVKGNQVKMYRPAEIRPAAPVNGQRVAPPNVVTAPQPMGKPKAISSKQAENPDFRNDLPRTSPDAVGTHISESAKPAPPPPHQYSNYEYDVNRPVKQPAAGEAIPQQQSRPMPQQSRPQEPAPRPQPAAPRSQPAPQQSRPAPAPQAPPARPAPAAQPSRATESGTRRQ